MLGSVLVRSLILPTLRVSVANELRFRVPRLTTDLTDLCHRYTFAEQNPAKVKDTQMKSPRATCAWQSARGDWIVEVSA